MKLHPSHFAAIVLVGSLLAQDTRPSPEEVHRKAALKISALRAKNAALQQLATLQAKNKLLRVQLRNVLDGEELPSREILLEMREDLAELELQLARAREQRRLRQELNRLRWAQAAETLASKTSDAKILANIRYYHKQVAATPDRRMLHAWMLTWELVAELNGVTVPKRPIVVDRRPALTPMGPLLERFPDRRASTPPRSQFVWPAFPGPAK